MKLSKFYHTHQTAMQTASLEALQRELLTGELSELHQAIEAVRDTTVQQSVAVLEALAAAKDVDQAVAEFRQVALESELVREGIAQVNATVGFTAESAPFAQVALEAAMGRLGDLVPVLTPSPESTDEKMILSTEGIDEVMTVIEATQGDVAAKSVDGILRVLDALKDALPDVKERLVALGQSLPDLQYDETVQIRLDDLVFKALAVEGRMPTAFKDYFVAYGSFANRILSAYSENALECASKAATIGEVLLSLGMHESAITATIAAYKNIGDPREGMDADQLCFVLPGTGALFGNPALIDDADGSDGADDVASVDETRPPDMAAGQADELIAMLEDFTTHQAPLDPLAYGERDAVEGDNPTIRVLSKESIRAVIVELVKALEIVDIKSFADARRQTWMQARSAFGGFQAAFRRISPSQMAELRPAIPAIGEYLDTVFALSAWPSLHLLTNLLFTANAFLLLAERSISGQTEEAPMEEVVEETEEADEIEEEEETVEEEEKIADDATPPADDAAAAQAKRDALAAAADDKPKADDDDKSATDPDPLEKPAS